MESAKKILTDAGLRATNQRLEIVSVLLRSPTPLSIEKILRKCKGQTPDMATAYRTVRELESVGITESVDVGHGHAHFELKRGDHHHLVCAKCGKTAEIENCEIESFEKKVLKRENDFKTIHSHRLTFFGLCKRCG
ncbi:MAG: hypothetical protein COV07_03780 [Candidatus Vogelbacteria bacterium CG10_big_fil_rev_8_21_14_0_10_45_14]|uniref:Transcriptional repressor n=1 Tax=Candidatus Vogelbacteria bacterium CG10_big_fil_rev_8_21_14_0_10_45_14 TaxID=1975042 RepID=A0A2H0RIZ9_9BACT|nr:MAG: hypothetical protein COV07_03780 [Candidatus Vogelbacteria bacterium CG10_big_fil_rev_8_21_14_0_10_45_14]